MWSRFLLPYREEAVLAIRVPLGIIFFAHGAQKVLGIFGGQGLSGTIQSFQETLGIPALLTVIAAFTEFLGGIAVLLGFLTGLSSLGIVAVMLVAIFRVHLPNGFFMNWYNVPNQGHGIEFNLALLGMALFLVFYGPGKYSLDRLITGKKREALEKTG
jgi:putative oxidoreductase